MIVPVMEISNLVLTRQIILFWRDKRRAIVHYREPVPLTVGHQTFVQQIWCFYLGKIKSGLSLWPGTFDPNWTLIIRCTLSMLGAKHCSVAFGSTHTLTKKWSVIKLLKSNKFEFNCAGKEFIASMNQSCLHIMSIWEALSCETAVQYSQVAFEVILFPTVKQKCLWLH